MRSSVLAPLAVLLLAFGACGPSSSKNNGNGDCNDPNNLKVDPNNCGTCGNKCDSSQTCNDGVCVASSCNPGESRSCYDGADGTAGVGPCVTGMQTCTNEGYWGICMGEVVPTGEKCGDNLDNNCNGMVDEDTDADGDGFTTCGGDCCDAVSDGCSDPKLVNPGAFDAPGNNLDDDCDGMKDNTVAACDTGLTSNTTKAMDFAKAIDLCQTATASDKKWGVISATFTATDGSTAVDPNGHAIRDKFGLNVTPKAGASLAEISSGVAADSNDNNPKQMSGQSYYHTSGASAAFPADWLQANGGALPNAPDCPAPTGDTANDPEMLTLTVRAPTNAKSFSLNVNFFSYEYPEWTCSEYNDFFVVLLDSKYAGNPANPKDKNLAFYQDANMKKYPVGVNLAQNSTGLFTECVSGTTGCDGTPGTNMSCKETLQLQGTGFEAASPLQCDQNSLAGGGTGWLQTSGNVVGGEVITLRIAIWDTSDERLDSIAVFDNFQWSVDSADPGTIVVN